MRLAHSVVLALVLGTLAACAPSTTTAASRGADTAVRAEPRRISDGSYLPDALRNGPQLARRSARTL
jgi:hypothetical protein